MNANIVNNDQKNNTAGQEFPLFDISDFLNNLLKFWWLCILLIVLCAGALFIRGQLRYTPQYQSSVTFTVQTSQLNSGSMGVSSYSFSYNRSLAAQLSTTFPSIIKSNILQDIVCSDLGLTSFPCSLSASVVSGTNMFTITSTGSEPQLTYDVLQSVIKNYPVVSQYVLGSTTLYILNEPQVPSAPSNQFAYRTHLLKGALIGLLLSFVWVMIYTLLRNTIRSRTDIRSKLNQQCIGVLPQVFFKKHNQEIDRSVLLNNSHISDSYRESFRAIRNSLLTSEEKPQVIMVTSTAPGEGKTTVAANLALSLAMMNKKVLIVDADLRNPNVNACFGVKPSPDEEQSRTGKISHLKFGSSYTLSILNFNVSKHGMWEILKVNHFQKLITQLRSRYDFIIVDTSPLGITSEPAVILQAVDASILVVHHDAVRTSRILSVIDLLQSTNTKLFGCILNGVSDNLIGYDNKYGYHYGYHRYGYSRYGYGSSHKSYHTETST